MFSWSRVAVETTNETVFSTERGPCGHSMCLGNPRLPVAGCSRDSAAADGFFFFVLDCERAQ
jgi:hypothetical protein